MNRRIKKKQLRSLLKLATLACLTQEAPAKQAHAYQQIFSTCPIDKYPIIVTMAYTPVVIDKIDTMDRLKCMYQDWDTSMLKDTKYHKYSHIRKWFHAQSLSILMVNMLIYIKLNHKLIIKINKELKSKNE